MFPFRKKNFQFDDEVENENSSKKNDSLITPLSPFGPRPESKKETLKDEQLENKNADMDKTIVYTPKNNEEKDQLQELLRKFANEDNPSDKKENETMDEKSKMQMHDKKKSILNIDDEYAKLSEFNYFDKSEQFHFMLSNIADSVSDNYSEDVIEFINSYLGQNKETELSIIKKAETKSQDVNNVPDESMNETGNAFDVCEIIQEFNYFLNTIDIPQRKINKYRRKIEKYSLIIINDLKSQEMKKLKRDKQGKPYQYNNKVIKKTLYKLQHICKKLSKLSDDNRLYDIEDDIDELIDRYDDITNVSDDVTIKKVHEEETDVSPKKKRKFSFWVKSVIALIVLLIIGIAGFTFYKSLVSITPIESAMTIELGEPIFPTASQFFSHYPLDMTIDASDINTSKIGTYNLITNDKYNGKQTFTVTVKDTTPPEVVQKYEKYQVRRTKTINPEDLIETVTDNDIDGELKVFLSQDTFQEMGNYTVQLTVQDASGNKTVLTQNIEVVSQWAETLNHTKNQAN